MRRVLAHSIAIVASWLAAAIASDHLFELLPHWEALVAAGGGVLVSSLARTSELSNVPRWAAVFTGLVAGTALTTYAYLVLRGPVASWELALPTAPWAALAFFADRWAARRGW
jgi:hypothetical protein